jgi:hypothetical protein
MGDIVWLASYPKSGNTWLRVFLANLQQKDGKPADINALPTGSAADRRRFDDALGVESSDLTRDEIERSRPAFYRALAAASAESIYLKVHDAYTLTSCGEPLFPGDGGSRAVYLVRNPLDVAISFAHHLRATTNAAIDAMANPDFAFGAWSDRIGLQLEQRLSSWSGHVLSWLDQGTIPVHLMRYEDMLREPTQTFGACLDFLEIDVGKSELERALDQSSFSALRTQEEAFGFRERRGDKPFFRSGRAGAWRGSLTDAEVHRVIREHQTVMRRLGYPAEIEMTR